MAIISQKEAAKRFAKKWEGRGREKQDDSKFWLDLLQNVFRVSDPYSLIEFQKPVKMESSTRFIDAFIPETRVLIEQKGVGEDLSKKHLQSGGDMLTPYEQARRYDQWMLPDEHPLWIVACNFKSFEIHDMRHPFDAPEVVLLEKNPWNGQLIRDIDLSRQTIIVMVKRGNRTLIPKGSTRLQAGDKLLLHTKESPTVE